MGQRCVECEYKHRKSVRSVSQTPKALLHLGFCPAETVSRLSANCQFCQPKASRLHKYHSKRQEERT